MSSTPPALHGQRGLFWIWVVILVVLGWTALTSIMGLAVAVTFIPGVPAEERSLLPLLAAYSLIPLGLSISAWIGVFRLRRWPIILLALNLVWSIPALLFVPTVGIASSQDRLQMLASQSISLVFDAALLIGYVLILKNMRRPAVPRPA